MGDFLYNKKYFYAISVGGGGVYDRGLSSDKQPVNAACKGASKSSLMKKSTAGKQEKNTKHLQPLTLGNGVCVHVKPHLGLLLEKVAWG